MLVQTQKITGLSAKQARKVAEDAGVKMPRVGYEMNLGEGKWLSSTGHFQFGWFGNEKCKFPYEMKEPVMVDLPVIWNRMI